MQISTQKHQGKTNGAGFVIGSVFTLGLTSLINGLDKTNDDMGLTNLKLVCAAHWKDENHHLIESYGLIQESGVTGDDSRCNLIVPC
jgi:hypothetical protein